MKVRAILLASVLLVGCQASKRDDTIEQRARSFSAAGQEEAGRFTSQTRWLDGGTFHAQGRDLWISIGDELKMEIPDNPRIHEQKQKYSRSKNYLHDVILRAEPYVYWTVGQVKKRSMSTELVLLPIMGSVFDPHATSSANAAGIQQTIPSIGRNYDLRQARSYDARCGVIISTTVALDMVQCLNKMFGSDWLLTVAAYNNGEGRAMKAVKANCSRGKPIDF